MKRMVDGKDVLISIQPHWIKRIIDGEKTVEIRKSRPRMWTPFKVYVYATAEKNRLIDIIRDGDEIYGDVYHGKPIFVKTYKEPIGGAFRPQMIVGEFMCDAVEELHNLFECEPEYHLPYNGECCLTVEELEKYGRGKKLYGWHIADFKRYREPKELADFWLPRPPQSWQYVERN